MGANESVPSDGPYKDLIPSNFPCNEGKTVTLKDGRKLGYEEYGVESSHKGDTIYIILIPGLPGSRLFSHPSVAATNSSSSPSDHKVRLIVVDRPGFGISSQKEGRTFLDFADDIAELADALHTKKFSIIGYSAGSPYALACMYKLHDRLYGAALVGTLAPPCAPNITKVKTVVKMQTGDFLKNPVKSGRSDFDLHHPKDREIYRTPEIETMFLRSALELATRKQEDNEIYEYTQWTKPWGFEIKDIKCPNVTIYHGELDRGTTIHMAKYIHENIANSKSRFFPDKGHLIYFEIWDEMIQTLITASTSESENENKEEESKQPSQSNESTEENKSSEAILSMDE